MPSPSGVPAAHTCVVSLHVPCPAHESAGVQLRAGSLDLQLYLQSLLQRSASVTLPSSLSSGAVTMPSPQREATQVQPRQSIALPQLVPTAGAVPALQTWSTQVSAPLHALPSSQLASTAQTN